MLLAGEKQRDRAGGNTIRTGNESRKTIPEPTKGSGWSSIIIYHSTYDLWLPFEY